MYLFIFRSTWQKRCGKELTEFRSAKNEALDKGSSIAFCQLLNPKSTSKFKYFLNF